MQVIDYFQIVNGQLKVFEIYMKREQGHRTCSAG
jgi:hypothetical protein